MRSLSSVAIFAVAAVTYVWADIDTFNELGGVEALTSGNAVKEIGTVGPLGLYYSFLDSAIQDQTFTQEEAEQQCLAMNKQLLSLDGDFKDRLVQAFLYVTKTRGVWTSATRQGDSFVWGTGEKVGYGHENWSRCGGKVPCQPDNGQGNENCLALTNNIQHDGIVWRDLPCSYELAFVCEEIPTVVIVDPTAE